MNKVKNRKYRAVELYIFKSLLAYIVLIICSVLCSVVLMALRAIFVGLMLSEGFDSFEVKACWHPR